MLTQEQLIAAFASGAANATPPTQSPPPVRLSAHVEAQPPQQAPPPTGVPIAHFHQHLENHKQVETAIAQHFDSIYQDIAAIKSFQRLIVFVQGGVMILLIIFLWAFFPIWQKDQAQRSSMSIAPIQSPL